ncbi:MAG: hypothetical protein ACI8R4_003898, partial [Paracoccaceae bacterium]
FACRAVDVVLAPKAAFRAAMLTGVPFITRQAIAQQSAEMAPSPSALMPVLSVA